MAGRLARFLLFLSSYFPLAAIFFILFVEKQRWVAISILSIGLLGLVGLAWYLRAVQRIGPFQVTVKEIQRRDAEAMSYIVSYLIPFIAVPFNGWQQGLALSIFFVVLGILYVNSNLVHINPMLNLAGYHLYEITLADDAVHSLITRRRVVRGEKLAVIKAGEDILMEKDL